MGATVEMAETAKREPVQLPKIHGITGTNALGSQGRAGEVAQEGTPAILVEEGMEGMAA